MKKRNYLFALSFILPLACFAQRQSDQFVDLTVTGGASQGAIAGSYVHNWKFGKSNRWEIGYGIRNTTYFGIKKDFTTAPARLARSTTFPFVIVFAGHETQNLDTLTVQRPLANSLNLSVHFGYTLHKAPGNYSGIMREVMTVIYYADGAKITTPSNDAQELDRKTWFLGMHPGEPAASAINPLLL